MIALKDISITTETHPLLNAASLNIQTGEKVVLRGPSGCGKSSLLKSIMGGLALTSGEIYVEGKQLASNTLSHIRSRISYIGQEPILGAEGVRDALLLPFTFKAHKSQPPTEHQISTLLDRLHLNPEILTQPCKRISGGEKQRIALIRALLLNKSIFLVDEVTSALDPESRTAVMAELFRPEITMLSASHDPEWINACDRIIEMQNHKLEETSHQKQHTPEVKHDG